MSKPIKGLPDETLIQEWAEDHAKGSALAVDALCAEVLRLRAELAKASAERDVAVAESRRQDTDLSTELSMANAEINRLRAEVQRLETAERLRSFSPLTMAALTGANPNDDPPADVLGEAFHVAMEEAARATSEYQRFGNLKLAIYELAQVVERLAVNQQGLKSLDEKISETIYCADPSKICPWLDRNNGESVENYVRRKTWESLVLLARRMGIEVRK